MRTTIGISEPKAEEGRPITVAWFAVFEMLAGVFVVGLFGIG